MEKLINVKEKGIEIEKRKANALEWIASALEQKFKWKNELRKTNLFFLT